MEKRINIAMVVLAVLLVLAVGYIAYDQYSTWKQQKDLSNFQYGAQYGYEQAVAQLAQQAQTCKPVSVMYNNQTINMIDIECLQQEAQ